MAINSYLGPRTAPALLLILGLMTSGPASTFAEQRPAAALKPGEIRVSTLAHPGTSVRWGHATGIVDAPVDQVMKTVGDYAAYHEFMPHFRISKVLSQRGRRALIYMEALIAKGTLKVWAQLKIQPEQRGDTQIIIATMTKGNLDYMEARWEISPMKDGRSLVTFDILVDPKIPLPAGLVSTENRKASKQSIRALRKRLAAQRP